MGVSCCGLGMTYGKTVRFMFPVYRYNRIFRRISGDLWYWISPVAIFPGRGPLADVLQLKRPAEFLLGVSALYSAEI